MKFRFLPHIALLLYLSCVPAANPQETPLVERDLTNSDRAFVIEHIGGVWEIEKRVFTDGCELKPPQVRGYLIITADFWTQIEAQAVEAGGVKPFSGSYFGSTDLRRTRSIEKVYLMVRTATGEDGKKDVIISTGESEQKTWLILENDAVVQKFDGGGEVRMADDRFSQKRGELYTTFWVRIRKPSEVFKYSK